MTAYSNSTPPILNYLSRQRYKYNKNETKFKILEINAFFYIKKIDNQINKNFLDINKFIIYTKLFYNLWTAKKSM